MATVLGYYYHNESHCIAIVNRAHIAKLTQIIIDLDKIYDLPEHRIKVSHAFLNPGAAQYF